MKRVKFLSTILGSTLLILAAACSNDDNKTTDKEQVNAAQAIEFKVDFADYNAEQDVNVTRAGNQEVKLEQQTVDLGNGILAQCILQRDTTKQTTPAETRALANDTYTMLAYDAATHAYKGDITGTVTGGVFTPTSSNQDIVLTPGTYDFVLFNSKVSRSGNNLTVTRTDADAALIGRTQQTIAATPHKQKVPFTMKHVGAKVKLKLTGYMDFSGVKAKLESVNATDVPNSSVYDASTGTWSVSTGAAVTENITYGANPEEAYKAATYTSTSGELQFMPATDISKLKLTFTAGTIYNQNMVNAGLTFHPATPLQLEQNGAYVLNVKLMYKFLYLMTDGSTGFIEATTYGGGTKTPIAVVVSQSKRLAVALNDAGGGAAYKWYAPASYYVRLSKTVVYYDKVFPSTPQSGEDETWQASTSYDNTTVKGTSPNFPAFKAAAEYTPTLPTGVHITGNMATKKWFLPSTTDWKYVLTALCFDKTNPTWLNYATLANIAFTQVGGSQFKKFENYAEGQWYWTSTEYFHNHIGHALCFIFRSYWSFINTLSMSYLNDTHKNIKELVRPFIHY